MNEAYNTTGPQFGAGIADIITVELHNSYNPGTIYYQNTNVFLSTNGIATITDIPESLSAEYFIVVKHRNSIETWSNLPISLSGTGPFSYNFTTSLNQAYGNNMKNVSGGFYAIFGGDADQDGIVDGSDMALIDNASTSMLNGYIFQDVNGDGIVDGSDMVIIDNNSTHLIQKQTPPVIYRFHDSFCSTGANTYGSVGSESYSVGQIFYLTDSGITGSKAEGVQQPHEISNSW